MDPFSLTACVCTCPPTPSPHTNTQTHTHTHTELACSVVSSYDGFQFLWHIICCVFALYDMNFIEIKLIFILFWQKTAIIHPKDVSSLQLKGSMLERAIRDLEKVVAECE